MPLSTSKPCQNPGSVTMHRRLPRRAAFAFALVALLPALLAAPVSANPFGSMKRLFKNWGLFEGVQVSGTNSLTFQQNMLQGSQSAWTGQRWDTAPVIRTSSLSLEGPIWKEFKFRADLSSSGYGQAYTRWMMGYEGNDSALYYGDLNVDLSGNQFATFNKAVSGWQLDQKIGRGLARVFYSKEKAITRYQTFTGNNTSGPFFLSYTPVVEGTEVVKIDEQPQILGQDYTLDYQTGQLYFEPDGKAPKIIPDTSTVSVSYQSSGYDSETGTVYGGRAEMPLMGDRMRLGVTMLQQQRAGGGASANDTVGYQEDIFQGSGSTGPFDVNYRPIVDDGTQVVYQGITKTLDQALVVLVDNVPKTDGVDYDSYRSIGRIIFRYSVPPTSLVTIQYYYDLGTTDTTGDLGLMGLDMTYAISPKLSLQAEFGHSDGGSGDSTGNALRTNLTYSPSDRLQVSTEYRNTAPSFTYMDSTGYYQQDKGLETVLNWRPAEHITVSARRSDLKSANGYTFGYGGYSGMSLSQLAARSAVATSATTATELNIQNTRNNLELKLEYPNWPTFVISREQLTNATTGAGSSDYKSMNYEFNYSPMNRPFTLSASLHQTDQAYLSTTGTETTDPNYTASNTRQFQWAATYKPGSRLSFSINRGQNSSTSLTSDSRSDSSTSQMSVRWTPTDKLDFNFDRTLTSSVGSLSSGGYYYSATDLAEALLTTADETDPSDNRYEDNRSEFKASYRPTSTLNFDFNLTQRKYTSGGSVGYLADSDQTTRSLSAVWQLNPALALNATVGSDTTNYLDADRGAVSNNQVTLGANYRVPNSPWTLSLSYNSQNGSSPTYTGYGTSQRMYIVANNLSDLRGQVSYALSETSELVLTGELSKYTGGYSNFSKQQAEIGFRRKLGDLADLTFGYRFIRNVSTGADDPRYSGNNSLTPSDQNYIANTFLVTLTSQFSSSLGGSGGTGLGGGMYGSNSLSNFGGYRVGAGTSNSFGGGNFGTGYSNYTGFGTSNMGYSRFGTGYSNLSGFGTSGSSQFGSFGSFGSNSGGFSTGLGTFSGQGGTRDGMGGRTQPEPPGAPGASAQEAPDLEDWQMLDDLLSVWW